MTFGQEQHSWPIFTDDWGADEELLLISGLIVHGLGNWIEVASHVGTRTKEECERHYEEVYLGVGPDGKDLDEDDDAQNVEMETGKRKREFMPVRPPSRHLGTAHLACSR